jgi:hypothetical protein
MSTVLIPVFADIIGPMVLPQGESFLTMNSWRGTPASFAIALRMEVPMESVVYF